MDTARNSDALALVTFDAPHGPDDILLLPGRALSFGRGADCEIRIAFAPEADRAVPRLAGRLVAAKDRVLVECADALGRRPLEIRADGVSTLVSFGEGHSPRTSPFEVLVHGSVRANVLTVSLRRPRRPSSLQTSDPPTETIDLRLTDIQRRILEAYATPVLKGLREPATHREVASQLNYSVSFVRQKAYEIYARMFEELVVLPEISERSAAIVEAAIAHGLLVRQ